MGHIFPTAVGLRVKGTALRDCDCDPYYFQLISRDYPFKVLTIDLKLDGRFASFFVSIWVQAILVICCGVCWPPWLLYKVSGCEIWPASINSGLLNHTMGLNRPTYTAQAHPQPTLSKIVDNIYFGYTKSNIIFTFTIFSVAKSFFWSNF